MRYQSVYRSGVSSPVGWCSPGLRCFTGATVPRCSAYVYTAQVQDPARGGPLITIYLVHVALYVRICKRGELWGNKRSEDKVAAVMSVGTAYACDMYKI